MSPETAVICLDPFTCRFSESRQYVGRDVACLCPLGVCTGGVANPPQFRNPPFEIGVVQRGQSVLNRLVKPCELGLGVGGLFLKVGDASLLTCDVLRPTFQQPGQQLTEAVWR